nr:septal ring lytic transglycosylase RlpA family protein [Methylobacterium dankookense]
MTSGQDVLAQSMNLPDAASNERFQGLRRSAPVFTYREVTSRLPPMPAEPEAGAAPRRAASGSYMTAGRSRPIESGKASWYQHPGRTASGEIYDPDRLTAAHRSLPFGKRVLVVNKRNGRSVVVRITDRTNARTQARRPYIVDLSRGSARALGIDGIGQVALYEPR